MNILPLTFLLLVQEKEISTYRARSISPYFAKNSDEEKSSENKIINKPGRKKANTNFKAKRGKRLATQVPEAILSQQEEIKQVSVLKIKILKFFSNFLLLMHSKVGLRQKNVLIGMESMKNL
jgi:hypothetical protein